MDKNITILIFVRGLYHYLGIEVDKQYRQSRANWLRNNRDWACSVCGERTNKLNKSVDHIIPKNIIWETGLVGLIFDHRNFRLAHKKCNQERGNLTINDMPDKLKASLFAYTDK